MRRKIMAKKKKKKKKISNKKKNILNVRNPRSFFKAIGIKPLVKPNEERKSYHIEEEIKKRLGSKTAESFRAAFEEDSSETAFEFCHKNLDLVKIWYGAEFNRIYEIANELKQLSIPNISNILDLGGGTGQIAFYMAKLWPECKITVADRYSDIGIEWAKEIGEDRVRFVDALLPDLKSLDNKQFDLILMSRVLGYMEELDLPSFANTFDTESFFNSPEGKRLFNELEIIAEIINNHLTQTGHLVIIDSWSDFRVLIVGRAFESKGLYIDLEHFDPIQVSMKYSAIVFSKTKTDNYSQDLPLEVSILMDFNSIRGGHVFNGSIAEMIRRLFIGATVVSISEFINEDYNVSYKNEILKKEGIALKYITNTQGARIATIGSSLSIPHYKDVLDQLQRSIATKFNLNNHKDESFI